LETEAGQNPVLNSFPNGGLTDHTGKGALDLDEAQKWVDWMKEHQFSWTS
jgi:hypothetical protein